jgi:hypothetical protein
MSHHTIPQPKAEFFDRKHAGPWRVILPVAALAGIAGCILFGLKNHEQFAFSWLFAFMYFFVICVGALFWTLVHHATDAEWSVAVRRILENVAGLIPVAFLFFIPLLYCAPLLWKWWTIPAGVDEALDHKQPYLSHGFFYARLAIYFIGLTAVALLMKRHSTRQDADGHPRHTLTMRKLAFGGIPVLGVSLTFAAIDWLMGLDYHWFSTMWGVYIFAGAAGSSMSLLVLLVTLLRKHGYLRHVVSREHYHIMGKLMFAFCVFWAYIGFSQYMLIWYSNLPEETSYFIRRNVESWNLLSLFLVIGRFFIPFPVLLLQATKKSPRWICLVAIWILFMQAVDMYLIVMPALHHDGFAPHILDLCSLLAIGAPLAFLFLNGLGRHSLFPLRDPRLIESIKLTN